MTAGLIPDDFPLKEEQSILVEEVEATMSPNHDRLIIRKWEGIDPTYVNLAAADLRNRTSMKNTKGVTKNYVTDPQVGVSGPETGGRVYTGRWRGVSVKSNTSGSSGVITQVLAYGLIISAEALPTPELVQTSDMLIMPHAAIWEAEKDRREVRYRGYDPAYVETAKSAIALTAGVVETRCVRMEDGSYNIHALQDTNVWVTEDNTAPIEHTRIKEDQGERHERNILHITKTSGDVIMDNPVAAWVTSTAYVIGDLRSNGGSDYMCKAGHTSGTFATDLAAGKWALVLMNRNVMRDITDGQAQIKQEYTEVTAISAVGDLTNPIVIQENEWIDLFGFKKGEHDRIAFIYTRLTPGSRTVCMAISDASLVTTIAGGGTWEYNDRKFEENEDGTARFIVIFRKIVWNAFTLASPDLVWQDSRGTQHENMTQLWFRVQKADALSADVYTAHPAWVTSTAYIIGSLATDSGLKYRCLTAHTSGTFATDLSNGKWVLAKYNVTNVNINDNRDGSVTISRIVKKEARGVSGSELENENQTIKHPHGFNSSTFNQIVIVNEGLENKSDAYVVPSSAWTLTLYKEEFRSDGYWDVFKIYEQAVHNAFTYTAPDYTYTDNYGTHHERVTEHWTNIDIDDALASLYTPTLGFNAMVVVKSDNHDGSMEITRVQWEEALGASGSELEADSSLSLNPHGFNSGTLARVLIINENLLDPSSAYVTISSGHSSYKAVDSKELFNKGSGLWDVYVLYELATWSNTTPTYRRLGMDSTGGYGEIISDMASGVPLTSTAAIMTALGGSTTTAWQTGQVYTIGLLRSSGGFVYECIEAHTSGTFITDLNADKWVRVVSSSLAERGEGEGVISKSVSPEKSVAEVSTVRTPSGNSPGVWRKTWYLVDPANVSTKWTEAQAWKTDEAAPNWQANTDYVIGNIITDNVGAGNLIYYCIVDHTSDATLFATDLALGYWLEITVNSVTRVRHGDGSATITTDSWTGSNSDAGAAEDNGWIKVGVVSAIRYDYEIYRSREGVILGYSKIGYQTKLTDTQFGAISWLNAHANKLTFIKGLTGPTVVQRGRWMAHAAWVEDAQVNGWPPT